MRIICPAFSGSNGPFFGYRPLDLCSCQFEAENVCSKDLDPPASKRACAVPTLLEKFEAELIAATQRPPTGNQNAPNFLLSRITHPCLPIVAFKLLWRPLFASKPSSICCFFRFTKFLSLNRLHPAYSCTSNTFRYVEQLSATFCTVFITSTIFAPPPKSV